MKLCRFCNQPLKDESAICIYCGYDPKTDRVDPTFKAQPERIAKQKIAKSHKGFDPRVKTFAFWGVILLLFSILFKYNFRIGAIMFDLTQIAARVKQGKPIAGKVVDSRAKSSGPLQWQSVRGHPGLEGQKKYDGLVVEGIFFDPSGKSLTTINGNVVAEGQYFKDILVKKVNFDSIEIVIDGASKTLAVNQRISLPQEE